MDGIQKLITGFRIFRATYFELRPKLYSVLATSGQNPTVMIVACADSRVDPAILMNAQPGELFVVRNVANLVPPYAPDGKHHATSAALEFAVRDVGVEHIVVMGHSQCGGVRAMADAAITPLKDREFLAPWVSMLGSSVSNIKELAADIKLLEQAGVRASLKNIRAFPWVRDKEADGKLALHGWWFDLEKGELWNLDEKTGEFNLLVG